MSERTDKRRAYEREWYRKNAEKIKARKRKYYECNREKERERGRKYAAEHRDMERDRSRRYHAEHREQILARQKEYRDSEEGKEAAKRGRERVVRLGRCLIYSKMRRGLSTGLIRKVHSCEDCGSTDSIQAHHEDYTKPLDVIWLCRGCHGKRHRRSG